MKELLFMTRVVHVFTTADAPEGPIHVILTDAKDDQVMMLTLANAYGGLTLDELNEQMGLKLKAKPLFARFDKWLSGWFTEPPPRKSSPQRLEFGGQDRER